MNNELKTMLEKHAAWLNDEEGGERANLYEADLSGAYLNRANLNRAYLSGANLSGANLSGAYLRGAYLSGAYLSGADLSGADLREAYLSGAYLSGAENILAIGPIGSRGDMLYAVRHETCVMVKTGCFWGTMTEFEEAVIENHAETEHGKHYQAAIALIRVFFEVTK